MDRDYFQEALQTFNNGNWYLFKKDWTGEKRMSYENLIIIKDGATMPTEAEVNAKIQELKDAEQAVIDKKASGKQKLKDLGLDDDEIKALMGA
jgi:hypothetical protein